MTGEPRPTGDDKWPAAAEKDLERVRELGRGNFGAVWLCKSKKAAEAKKADGGKDLTAGYVAVKVRLHLCVQCAVVPLPAETITHLYYNALICRPFIASFGFIIFLRSLLELASVHSPRAFFFSDRTLTYPSHLSRHMQREKLPYYPRWIIPM